MAKRICEMCRKEKEMFIDQYGIERTICPECHDKWINRPVNFVVHMADKHGFGCGWNCETKEEVFELLDKYIHSANVAIMVESKREGIVLFRPSEETELTNNKIGYKAS